MIPIYRAKKIDSDEYVIGYCEYIPNDGRSINIINSGCWISWIKLDNKGFRDRFEVEVDLTTLAIHFPDMIDSQGNKIFASLSEDGKGGDMVNLDEGCGENFNAVTLYRYYEIHLKGGIDLLNRAKYLRCYPKKDIKVIGIQE